MIHPYLCFSLTASATVKKIKYGLKTSISRKIKEVHLKDIRLQVSLEYFPNKQSNIPTRDKESIPFYGSGRSNKKKYKNLLVLKKCNGFFVGVFLNEITKN